MPQLPDLELVFSIEAFIDPPRSSGPGLSGERLHIPITGGVVTGPRLTGKILPGGSDWPLIRTDGNSSVEAHYTIEASDGTLIYIVNKALRRSSVEVLARLRGGEPVAPDEFYFRGAPTFDVPNGSHQWLRENLFICSLEPKGLSILIDVYQVT